MKTKSHFFLKVNQKLNIGLIVILSYLAYPQTILANPNITIKLPPLSYLEEAALEHAGLGTDKIKSFQKRSRWAAALPRVQVAWENSLTFNNTNTIEDNLSVTSAGVTIGPESSKVDQDWQDDKDFSVRAVWSFDELLFNRDELVVAREARDQYFIRKRLIDELQHHYFNLKALYLEAQLDPEAATDPLHALRMERHYLNLNSLSGRALERWNSSKDPKQPTKNLSKKEKYHALKRQKAFADFYRSLKLPRR